MDKTANQREYYQKNKDKIRANKKKYRLLQLWKGTVNEILENEFTAMLENKTNPELIDELATFDKEELTPDDLQFLVEGAEFYLTVGYLDYPGRGRARETRIKFKKIWKKEYEEKVQGIIDKELPDSLLLL